MALKKLLTLALSVTALISSVALIIEFRRHLDIKHYNTAVSEKSYADAESYLGDFGQFAKAYSEQQLGEYQTARVIYSRMEKSKQKGLRVAALYNLANSYMQQASTVDMNADADLAIPLIELAKISYRKALSLNSEYWNARHNLETALFLVPDSDPRVPMEVEGRRGAVRTVISADSEDNLP